MEIKKKNFFSATRNVAKRSTVAILCTLVIGFFLSAASCDKLRNGSSPPTAIFPERIITPILVSKGDYFASHTPSITQQKLVIKTATEWENLINNIYEYALEDFFVDTADRNIDFLQYQVIAVIDGLRPPIWTIDITDITEYADKIVVTYTNLDTTRNLMAVAWQPYRVVKIPASNKEVVFDYDEEKKGGKGL